MFASSKQTAWWVTIDDGHQTRNEKKDYAIHIKAITGMSNPDPSVPGISRKQKAPGAARVLQIRGRWPSSGLFVVSRCVVNHGYGRTDQGKGFRTRPIIRHTYAKYVGNALVCIAVYTNHTMRTVTNIFIVNLAVADFFVILFCLPPTVVWDVTETWFMGKAMCKVVIYFQRTSLNYCNLSPGQGLPSCVARRRNFTFVVCQRCTGQTIHAKAASHTSATTDQLTYQPKRHLPCNAIKRRVNPTSGWEVN
uniref:G-protein coupled receptors family 1 profile domain-containing protein n=1 Tax=Anopheles minimus TaxID=112268 RepID=A0A182WCN7_9DIPT